MLTANKQSSNEAAPHDARSEEFTGKVFISHRDGNCRAPPRHPAFTQSGHVSLAAVSFDTDIDYPHMRTPPARIAAAAPAT